MLENCCSNEEAQAVVLVEVGVHLSQVLAGDLVYLA
jgi:hypothetical protein